MNDIFRLAFYGPLAWVDGATGFFFRLTILLFTYVYANPNMYLNSRKKWQTLRYRGVYSLLWRRTTMDFKCKNRLHFCLARVVKHGRLMRDGYYSFWQMDSYEYCNLSFPVIFTEREKGTKWDISPRIARRWFFNNGEGFHAAIFTLLFPPIIYRRNYSSLLLWEALNPKASLFRKVLWIYAPACGREYCYEEYATWVERNVREELKYRKEKSGENIEEVRITKARKCLLSSETQREDNFHVKKNVHYFLKNDFIIVPWPH